jgi:tyrosyl-tRNA synthetase
MIRRMGRPGLVGTMARTAVIAGTATAVVGGMQGRQQSRAQAANEQQAAEQQAMEQQAQIDAMQSQLASAPAQQAAAAPEDDTLTKLAKLGQMKEAGLIDDSEFAAAKAKVLGI